MRPMKINEVSKKGPGPLWHSCTLLRMYAAPGAPAARNEGITEMKGAEAYRHEALCHLHIPNTGSWLGGTFGWYLVKWSIYRPDDSQVKAEYINTRIRVRHAEIGVMDEVERSRHRHFLRQLLA